jgi:hypothetical protein
LVRFIGDYHPDGIGISESADVIDHLLPEAFKANPLLAPLNQAMDDLDAACGPMDEEAELRASALLIAVAQLAREAGISGGLY